MNAILEVLKPYAVDLPSEKPPEILPWEFDTSWGLLRAAKGALGLLVSGEKPGEHMFEVAEYLLVFCTTGYTMSYTHRDGQEESDGLLLNGTALALFGYVCADHPEAELWRVTGCARVATQAHKRRAELADQMLADCVLAVGQMADACDAPILSDLITLRERMWGKLLDHSRAERLHVSKEDYPTHMKNAVGVDEVGGLMRDRDWMKNGIAPDYKGLADLEDADACCNNLITLRAHMLVRHQFGSDIDWHLRLFDDVESTVSLGAMPFVRNLVTAYEQTGDEKYAVHCARILWSFYRGATLPNHRQTQGPWRTLEVGNRQANMWPAVLACLGHTDAFDDATHAMIARSRLEHMRYAMAYCGYPNNWYQVEASGMATAALFSPELRQADAYLRVAMRRLKWINSFAYYDDGFQFELTHLYHVFPTSSMFGVVRAAKARGVDLPADFVQLMERAHEMYLFAVMPNHILPTFNDCNPQPTDPATLLGAAADTFGRDDFHWATTHGAEGQAPDHTSHAWENCGLYVMRNRWDKHAQYLHFDGAPWGASHQHEDKLNFILYANGRLLLGDPNIYSYAPTELTHYFKSSRAHNVVLVDGRGQARRFFPEAKLETEGRNEWHSNEAFDFVSSEYLEGFAPDPYPDRSNSDAVDRSISHRRSIFYVKDEYWILCDLIRGEGMHQLEQLFHVAPLETGDAKEPLRAGLVDVSSGAIVTKDDAVGNLAILPVDRGGLKVNKHKGEMSPAAGWWGILGEFPAWEVNVQCERELPARLDAVLFPLGEGQTDYPRVERLYSDANTTAVRVVGNNFDDTFILCEEDTGVVTVGDVTFEGRAVLIRQDGGVRAVDGLSLTIAGNEISLS